jgi:hypothetical protein
VPVTIERDSSAAIEVGYRGNKSGNKSRDKKASKHKRDKKAGKQKRAKDDGQRTKRRRAERHERSYDDEYDGVRRDKQRKSAHYHKSSSDKKRHGKRQRTTVREEVVRNENDAGPCLIGDDGGYYRLIWRRGRMQRIVCQDVELRRRETVYRYDYEDEVLVVRKKRKRYVSADEEDGYARVQKKRRRYASTEDGGGYVSVRKKRRRAVSEDRDYSYGDAEGYYRDDGSYRVRKKSSRSVRRAVEQERLRQWAEYCATYGCEGFEVTATGRTSSNRRRGRVHVAHTCGNQDAYHYGHDVVGLDCDCRPIYQGY